MRIARALACLACACRSSGEPAADAGVVDTAAPDAAPPADRWVSPTGDDGNLGTEASPFRTIAHAVEGALPGATIWLLDGDYDSTTQPQLAGAGMSIPVLVTVAAARGARVSIQGTAAIAFDLAGSATIRGLRFKGFPTAIAARTGTVIIDGCQFADDGRGFVAGALELSGDVRATLTPPTNDLSYLWGNSSDFAHLSDVAKLTVAGGRIDVASESGLSGDGLSQSLFLTAGGSRLIIAGTSFDDDRFSVVTATGDSYVTLQGVTISKAGCCFFFNAAAVVDNARLEIAHSTISDSPVGPGVSVGRGQGDLDAPSLFVVNSVVENNASEGIRSGANNSFITIEASTIQGNGGAGIGGRVTYLEIRNSMIIDNGTVGVLPDGGGVVNLTIRNTRFVGQNRAVNLVGAAGSIFDLGAWPDPGGNTFIGASQVEVYMAAAQTVAAAGNTWNPSVQGADADGHYTAPAGAVLEVSGPTSGLNYQLPAGGTLRLAEAP